MKYSTVITGWGEDALAFLDNDKAPFIIIFNENAPPELAEIAILHKQAPLLQIPEVGDSFIIGKKIWTITAVGEEAKQTLAELGHCTVVFKGSDNPDRPGCIMLSGEPLEISDIQIGYPIQII